MEAATSNFQQSYGLGPRGPNPKLGGEPSQGPHEAAPPRPEGHHHHKPFFFIQPPQPYLPMQSLQWPVPVPMPVSYNHYYGYPGLGYGLPMMPHYQPNPYMESPGFVVPHTNLHLMDYRRMLNPQCYQTMAYHARRFRYQHNPSAKEMTSSEVQTEPLVSPLRSSTPSPNDCSNTPSLFPGQLLSSTVAVQKESRTSELQEKVPSSGATGTPPNGSFVIQTEEVRIECCTTPVGLQLLRAHETGEMPRSFPQDMVQCSTLLHSHVLQDEELHLSADESKEEHQVCPDILLVGKPSIDEKIQPMEEPRDQRDRVTAASDLGSQEEALTQADESIGDEAMGVMSKNFHLNSVHLPFDPKYLDELRRMESTVWSAEETLSPPELLIQNGFVKSNENGLTALEDMMEQEMLVMNKELPTKEIVHVIEMLPLTEDELKDAVPVVSEAGTRPATEDAPRSELTNSAETLSPNVVMEKSSPKTDDQHRLETNDEDEDTSFESLPAYLPSTSWLSDLDHIYYSSKMPPAPKKQSRPLSSHGSDVSKRRRLNMDYIEQPSLRKPKEGYKPKGKSDQQSFSDHECCVSRNLNENLSSSYFSKKRLCSRCLAKRRICTSPGSGCDDRSLKRKALPLQQWNETLLTTCEACRSHAKRQLIKGSSPGLYGHRQRRDTEGESSGNGSCSTSPIWRPGDDCLKSTETKRLASKQNVNKHPAVIYPKLREKNCVCNHLQPQLVPLEKLHHCPHGNALREMDENHAVPGSLQNKWRNVGLMYLTHRWQTEKSWRDVMPNASNELSTNDSTSQHLINRKTQPQSQGNHNKDTRC